MGEWQICGYKKNEITLVGLIGYKYKKKELTQNVWVQGDPTWYILVRLDKNPVLVRFSVILNKNRSRMSRHG